jgi:hypothetical protein
MVQDVFVVTNSAVLKQTAVYVRGVSDATGSSVDGCTKQVRRSPGASIERAPEGSWDHLLLEAFAVQILSILKLSVSTSPTFANKRFFVRRLNSGALLMVRNNSPDGKRSHMTAFVSDDDGATWKGGLLLDERESSYPDGIQAEDGTLFIIYDHQRYTLNRAGKRGVGSVQIAVFGEEDVRAGKPVTDKVRLHQVVTQLQDTDDTLGAPGK